MRTGSPTACPRTRRDGHRRREKRAGQTLVLPPPANFPNRTAFQTTEPRGKSFSKIIRGLQKPRCSDRKQPLPHVGRKSEFGQPQLHGVAEDGSSRREPWGTMRPREKPRQGRQSWVQEDFLSPLRGSNFQYPNPRLTPWATLLPLLRSFLPQLSKTDLPT